MKKRPPRLKYNEADTEYKVIHKAYEEGIKLHYDLAKHLTTLNAGSVIIILTVFEKLFRDKNSLIFLITSLCAIAISMIASIFLMMGCGSLIRDIEIGYRQGSRFRGVLILIVISAITFFMGLLALAVAVILNINTIPIG